MIGSQWRVKPQLEVPKDGVWLGSGSAGKNGVWLGTLAEVVKGKQPKVWLSATKEHVVAIVGKRGSGKSFSLGVIAEGLGSEDVLGVFAQRRGVVLFDPLDVYWPTKYPVGPSENEEANRHFTMAKRAGVDPQEINVVAWVPGASNRIPTDPEWFRTYLLPVADMGLSEWELLLGANIATDPMGQMLADTLNLVQANGYHIESDYRPPQDRFDLVALEEAITSIEIRNVYHAETARALRQRLSSLRKSGLFSKDGTPIDELVRPGQVTVMLLGRLPDNYRTAIVGVVTRMLIDARTRAAFAEKRLALDPHMTPEERVSVGTIAEASIPKTHVILDEAQSFLAPNAPGMARDLFIKLVKEGRNIGLSAVMATQQPSAIDKRVLSQVETFIAHQLVTEPDIRALRENLKSSLPESIQFGTDSLDLSSLLRHLPAGTCLVSAADINTAVRRAVIVAIRPRATVHGGIEL